MRPATLITCILTSALLSTAAGAAIRPSPARLGGNVGQASFQPASFHPDGGHGFDHGWGHTGGGWDDGGHGHGWGWGGGHGGPGHGWGGGWWHHGGGGDPCSP